MKLVAITGSIGCGKTTIAKIIKRLGYAVFDLDAWVRTLYYNKKFLEKLKINFSECVKNGDIDKRCLRNLVFSDSEKLKNLENLIYPFLNKKIKNKISSIAKKNYVFFIDAALLFEKGWDKYCDAIILADVDYDIQKQRVMKRDNISEKDFEKINNLQINNNDKKKFADFVVDTNKSANMLKRELILIIKELEN